MNPFNLTESLRLGLRMVVDFAVYQRVEEFNPDWEQYRRIDFKWNGKREELSFNIGSENTLISRQKETPAEGAKIVNEETQLVYKCRDDTPRKIFAVNRIISA